MSLAVLLVMALAGPAFAQDEGDLDPTGVPDVRGLFDDEEDDIDIDLSTPGAPKVDKAPALDLDPGEALPLSGVREPVVVAATKGAVIVEQPVFVTRTRATTEAGFLLIATFSVGDTPVTEVRQVVSAESLAVEAPTWAFPKATVPVEAERGEIAVEIATAALDGSEKRVAFTKRVAYRIE